MNIQVGLEQVSDTLVSQHSFITWAFFPPITEVQLLAFSRFLEAFLYIFSGWELSIDDLFGNFKFCFLSNVPLV